jgi:hypothetical protein
MDLVLAIALGALAAVTAGLGAHLAMSPAETRRAKIAYRSSFIAIGLSSCALIAWQAYRANQAAKRADAKMDAVILNTSQIPQLRVNTEQPPRVTIENKFDPSAFQHPEVQKKLSAADEKRAKALKKKRAELRKHLVDLLREAMTVKDSCFTSDDDHNPSFGWRIQVRRALTFASDIDDSYLPRFMNAKENTPPVPHEEMSSKVNAIWNSVDARCRVLSEIIAELKD